MVYHSGGVHVGSSDRPIGVRIFILRNLQGLQGEVLGVARLVEDGFPHQHGGVVAVAADDAARVLMHLLVPARILVPVLPARGSHDDEQSQLVTGIHERGVLRIMGGTDDGKAGITQALGIAPLLRVGQGVAHVCKVLMAIGTNELVILLAIEVEAGLATLGVICPYELEGADADAGDAAVERLFALLDAGGDTI